MYVCIYMQYNLCIMDTLEPFISVLHSEKSMFYTTVELMHNFVLHYFTLVYISGILPLYNLCNETLYTAM